MNKMLKSKKNLKKINLLKKKLKCLKKHMKNKMLRMLRKNIKQMLSQSRFRTRKLKKNNPK